MTASIVVKSSIDFNQRDNESFVQDSISESLYFVIINVKMYRESNFQLSMPNNDEVQCSEVAGGYSLSLFPIVQCPVVAIVCPMSIYLPIFWLTFKKSTNLFSMLRLFTCSVALKLFLDSLNKKYNNKYKY